MNSKVQEAVVACPPCVDPLEDIVRYPFMSPIRPVDYPEDEDSLDVAKRVVAKTSNVDMSCWSCRKGMKKGHVKGHGICMRIPLKECTDEEVGTPNEALS